ncbi:MAG TPA: NTP transferase domain-containing protein [Methylomirabilota bacterium]|nr:NTP transferase domain-containing protein [Methylomirabilota bacterium]
MNTQFVILAAGKGTRMNSDLPKVLVKLGGIPLIQRLINNLNKLHQGNNIIIVTGHKRDLVEAALGPSFLYAVQEDQLGTAHALKTALPYVSASTVLVLYGDMPFIKAESLEQLLQLHLLHKSIFSMFTANVENFTGLNESFQNFGRIVRKDGKIQKIVEYKYATEDEKQIREVNPGIYLFDSSWLKNNIDSVNKNTQGEFYLTDLLELAVNQKLPIETAEIDPKDVYGINTPEQLTIAQKLV